MMGKKSIKPYVEGLNDLEVNTLCCLYSQPYSSHGDRISEKAERAWNAIVQRRGGIIAEIVEVQIPLSVWRTAMEVNRYLPKTELAVRLHAYMVIHDEEPFELQGTEGTVSEIVQQLNVQHRTRDRGGLKTQARRAPTHQSSLQSKQRPSPK